MLILRRMTGQRLYIGSLSVTVQSIDALGAVLRVCEYERIYTINIRYGKGAKIDRNVYITVSPGKHGCCWKNIRIGIEAPRQVPIERDDMIKGKTKNDNDHHTSRCIA